MDISRTAGSDLSLDTTGDLAAVDGSAYVQQRVLRRLMTNPGGYIWNLTYGGGLPGYVGLPINLPSIETAIRNQMLLEASVARSPVPTVGATSNANDTVILTVTYADAVNGAPQTITLTPGS